MTEETLSQRVYLDTSAYLSVLLREKDAARIQFATRKRLLCSSTLLLIEAERNLLRLARENYISPQNFDTAKAQLLRDKELFIFRDVSIDLCSNGIFPPLRIPRSSDLVHLRTAHWFRENGGILGFLTLDTNQSKAAQEMGLVLVL
jgi:hypothetical protein